MSAQRECAMASAQRERAMASAGRERSTPGAARGRETARRPAGGMTLLELLVALSIFAIVGTVVYPVINGAISSRRDATARVDLDAEARMILDRIEQDIVGNLDVGFQGPLPPRFVAAAVQSRDLATEHTILETTTLVARGVTPADAFVGGEDVAALAVDRGDQADVLWRIDSSGRLLRQEVRPPRPLVVDWTKIPFEVLSERAIVELEFYEPAAWLDAWDSGELGPHRGRAPVAVRTTVRVGGEDEDSVELVSTVVLPVIETTIDLRRAGGNTP